MTNDTLTTTEVADKLGTDGRTLRRFLRSTDQGVGTGKRYTFDSAQVTDLKKRFIAWRKEMDEAKPTEAHTCSRCGKGFKSASGLASHTRSHES